MKMTFQEVNQAITAFNNVRRLLTCDGAPTALISNRAVEDAVKELATNQNRCVTLARNLVELDKFMVEVPLPQG